MFVVLYCCVSPSARLLLYTPTSSRCALGTDRSWQCSRGDIRNGWRCRQFYGAQERLWLWRRFFVPVSHLLLPQWLATAHEFAPVLRIMEVSSRIGPWGAVALGALGGAVALSATWLASHYVQQQQLGIDRGRIRKTIPSRCVQASRPPRKPQQSIHSRHSVTLVPARDSSPRMQAHKPRQTATIAGV